VPSYADTRKLLRCCVIMDSFAFLRSRKRERLARVHAKLMADLEEGKKVARPSLDVDSLSCIGNLCHLIFQSRNLPYADPSITLARTFGTITSIAWSYARYFAVTQALEHICHPTKLPQGTSICKRLSMPVSHGMFNLLATLGAFLLSSVSAFP
jgi:hypothetical protein